MARKLHLDPILVQAVIAGSLSFAHLHDMANAAGQTGWKAWAYPVSVDLLLVASWRRMRILRSAGQSARAAWCWFLIALAASLGANVATAGLLDMRHVPAALRVLVAGWPALAFLGGTLLAHTTAPNAPVSVPVPDLPAGPGEAATFDRAPAPVPDVPEPVPALPPADPTPAPAPAPAAVPVVVPAALLDHARKIADAHRTATGTPIDPATLRARLGVPPVLADAITAQLA